MANPKRKNKVPARPQAPAAMPAPAAGRLPKINTAREACIVAAFGATGTGKSTFIKAELIRAPGPHLIFDPKHEYEGGAVDEVAFLQRAGVMPRMVLRPSFDADLRVRQFDRFCFAALSVARARGRVTVVADELHLVTAPGKAPRYWRELIETGRALGVSVYCASIRPAAVDKSLWVNATRIRAGRLNNEDDCRTVANSLGVPWRDLLTLKSGAGVVEFVERDLLTGATKRGQLTF